MPVSMSYYCRAVMSAKDLFPYQMYKEKFTKLSKRRGFQEALKQIREKANVRKPLESESEVII